MRLTLTILLCGASFCRCQDDQLAVAASSLDAVAPPSQTSVLPPSLPKAAAASTPLALLLATANKPAAPPLPLLPLAPSKPTGLRIKRKPQISKFRPKDRKRFRPRARVTESSVNNEVHEDKDEEAKIDSTTKLETRKAASKVNKKSKAAHTS